MKHLLQKRLRPFQNQNSVSAKRGCYDSRLTLETGSQRFSIFMCVFELAFVCLCVFCVYLCMIVCVGVGFVCMHLCFYELQKEDGGCEMTVSLNRNQKWSIFSLKTKLVLCTKM